MNTVYLTLCSGGPCAIAGTLAAARPERAITVTETSRSIALRLETRGVAGNFITAILEACFRTVGRMLDLAQTDRMVADAVPGAPYTWARPTFGLPGTWRSPASPRSWRTSSWT